MLGYTSAGSQSVFIVIRLCFIRVYSGISNRGNPGPLIRYVRVVLPNIQPLNKTLMSDENQTAEEIEEHLAALRKAAEPLIKYLAENHHPHVKAIVTSSSVELMEGIMSIPEVTEFARD